MRKNVAIDAHVKQGIINLLGCRWPDNVYEITANPSLGQYSPRSKYELRVPMLDI